MRKASRLQASTFTSLLLNIFNGLYLFPLKKDHWEFPDGPVMRPWGFHYQSGVQSLIRKLRSCKICSKSTPSKKITKEFPRWGTEAK